ncbi:MAG: hypothetical protein ACREHD_20250, partial [Pirellulales bacterium]
FGGGKMLVAVGELRCPSLIARTRWQPTRNQTIMSKNQRNTPRMPATKFANLRKKMQKQKVQAMPPKKK